MQKRCNITKGQEPFEQRDNHNGRQPLAFGTILAFQQSTENLILLLLIIINRSLNTQHIYPNGYPGIQGTAVEQPWRSSGSHEPDISSQAETRNRR